MSEDDPKRTRYVTYMLWVKRQPCLLCNVTGAGECDGPIEADHAGVLAAADVQPSEDLGAVDGRGTGLKPDDRTTIPLCQRHHRDRTDHRGYFAPERMSKEEHRLWRLSAIARTQMRWRLVQHTIPADVF